LEVRSAAGPRFLRGREGDRDTERGSGSAEVGVACDGDEFVVGGCGGSGETDCVVTA